MAVALSTCLQSLSKFLQRIDCVIPLKEVILQQLSAIMWTLCSAANFLLPAEGAKEQDQEPEKLYALPTKLFLQNAQQELLKVYEVETAKFSKTKSGSGKFVFPPAEGVGAGGLGRFSTYFQALLEFVLAGLEYQHRFHKAPLTTVPSSSSGTLVSNSSPSLVAESTSSSNTEVAPSCIRSNSGSSTSVQSDVQFPPLPLTSSAIQAMTSPGTALQSSRSEVSTSATPTACAAPIMATHTDPIAGKKLTKRTRSRKGLVKKDAPDSTPKKEEWLNIVRRSSTLLREVALETSPLPAAVSCDPKQKLPSSIHPSSRLVVLTRVSASISLEAAGLAIRKVCRLYGGLYKDKLYLPPESVSSHHLGHAVLELCCGAHSSAVCSALLTAPGLQLEGGDSMQAMEVNNSLTCGGKEGKAKKVLSGFLRSRLEGEDSNQEVIAVLSAIFNSSCVEAASSLSLSQVSGTLFSFFSSFASVCAVPVATFMAGIWEEFGKEDGLLDFAGFRKCFERDFKLEEEHSMRGLWLGLIDAGYDLNLERYPLELPAQSPCSSSFSRLQDRALVGHVDTLCRHLSVTASSLQPWDVFISEAEKTSKHLSSLQGLSLLDIRRRFFQLKLINQQLSLLLPLIDLRSTHPLSLGRHLSSTASLLFYDVKISFFHSVLNASTRRSIDQAPPEIKMDPLESVGGLANDPLKTHFCQAAQQMLSVPSPQLCVSLASGGDPTYAFNVKLSGEEVHGTSGSFRHFLWKVVRELQSSILPLLLPCPSSAVGINHGKYILAPGPISYSEEKLLQFFGQLLGVAVRADVPITIDFLPCFWKSLRGEPLSLADLEEADCVTHNLTCKILSAGSPQDFEAVVSTLGHIGSGSEDADLSQSRIPCKKLSFVYMALNGLEVELIPGGRDVTVEYSNRTEYVDALRRFRLEELSCPLLVKVVQCGLASVLPLQLLSVLTAEDLSLRVCGLPNIDLEYLKRHTMYQVGLMESDRHVQFFWNALESFSQDELRKFIKFACNQERIPFGLPCRDGRKDSETHVPPYPMKIAPPDGRGPPDDRYVRAETCMFMIKLPQYSSQQVMTERLRYAVHCREDPLSG